MRKCIPVIEIKEIIERIENCNDTTYAKTLAVTLLNNSVNYLIKNKDKKNEVPYEK